jgi:hypothetical protein
MHPCDKDIIRSALIAYVTQNQDEDFLRATIEDTLYKENGERDQALLDALIVLANKYRTYDSCKCIIKECCDIWLSKGVGSVKWFIKNINAKPAN